MERGVDLFIENADFNKYRISHLGRKDRIPLRLRERLSLLEHKTRKYKDFNLILGVDYGGKDEIIRIINKIIKSSLTKVSEEDLRNFSDLPQMPDPDLIIRTGGENRLSGYLPFNSSHSELYFTNIPFPDFTTKDLELAIQEYYTRTRRFGK